jgi:HEAT repeat protein
MPEGPDPVAKKGSRRRYWIAGGSLFLLVSIATFYWFVVRPELQAREKVKRLSEAQAIIETMETISEADAREVLKGQPGRLAWYQDRMRLVDWRGLAAIRQAGGPQRALPLLRLYIRLPKRVAPERLWAVFLMGYCGIDALPDVLQALESSDLEIRDGGYNAILRIGPEAIPELLRILESQEIDKMPLMARLAIIETLGTIGPPARIAVPTLIKYLTNPEMNTRAHAAEALGKIGPDARSAVPVLRKTLLKDPDEFVRASAAGALDGIGPGARDAEPDLLVALSDKSSFVRAAAACALASVGANPKQAVPKIIKLLRDPDTHVQWMAAYALRDFGSFAKRAVPELERLLNDADKQVRKAAAGALERITAVAESGMVELEKHLDAGGALGVNNHEVAKVFNADRKELGARFRSALVTFVGQNPERHYWAVMYLSSPDYRGDNKPLPQFALALMRRGISLCKSSSAPNARGYAVSLNVSAAIFCKKRSMGRAAADHKRAVEALIAKYPVLAGGFPALSPDDRKIYASIETDEGAE